MYSEFSCLFDRSGLWVPKEDMLEQVFGTNYKEYWLVKKDLCDPLEMGPLGGRKVAGGVVQQIWG